MPVTKRDMIKFLSGKLPILQWAPKYTSHKFMSDTIAGITVALTVMPQALAYATLGGLEPQVCIIRIIIIFCNALSIFLKL